MRIVKTLVTEAEIKKRIAELGKQLTKDYKGKKLVLLCTLKGALPFTADLMREIDLPLSIECIRAKSYVGCQSTGTVMLEDPFSGDISDKNFLVIEDIIDTGLTMEKLRELIFKKNPASFKICTLLYKRDAHPINFPIDYIGFDIPNEFVAGYGLDYDEEYRNIKDVVVLGE